MNAPQWPAQELVELYQSFLRLRHSTIHAEIRALACQTVMHPASLRRLETARASVFKKSLAALDLWNDVLHEAMLVLIDWLSADALQFEDRGVGRFAGWYWTLCRRACRLAAEKCRAEPFRPLSRVDPGCLAVALAPPPLREHPFDTLARAIQELPEGRMKDVVYDWFGGLDIGQSAARRGLCTRTVRRLRQRAVLHLLRQLSSSAEDEL